MQNDAKLEIYWGSGSPNSWRVLLGAEVKRIPYESKLMEFSKGDHKKPEFLAINPRGKMPAIRHGDFTLGESLAILAYLDRLSPEPALFGRNAREAGRIACAISDYECYTGKAVEDVAFAVLFRPSPEATERAKGSIPALKSELARLEESCGRGPWLAGETISAADIAVFPGLQLLLRAAGKDAAAPLDLGLLPFESHYPKLAAWCKRIEALPGYQRTYPPHWR